MKISVIIPAYNVEQYIVAGIESAVNQTYKDIEIIVVNDGSTDQTGEIAEKYAAKYSCIKYLTQSNKGVSAARNNALENAKGEYVMFLDSDDWLDKGAAEKLAENIESDIELICSACYFVSKKNDRMEKEYIGTAEKFLVLNSEDAFEYIGADSPYRLASSCYKLFDKKIIDKYNIRFDEDIYHGEDGLFVYKYLHHCNKIKYINDPLWNILDRPGSATKEKYSPKLRSSITAVERMLEYKKTDINTKHILYSLMASRAMLTELTALRADKDYIDDILYSRSVLQKYKKYFLKRSKRLKLHLQCFVLTKFPIKIVKLLVKREGKK